MNIVRFKTLIAGWLAVAAAGAWAMAAVLPLAPTGPAIQLGEHMSVQRLPLSEPIDPDALWRGATAAPLPAQPRWQLAPDERVVGAVTLQGSGAHATYVVEVPAPSVDEVRVWHREAGGAWQASVAGDRVALSRWPFASQFPAFPVVVGEAPVDLIVAVANSGPVGVAVGIVPDAVFRETQTLRANLAGVVMGLGAMVAVVCALGALNQRRRASWLLAAVCVFTLVMAACVNGYMALWLTPEAPEFNDASKPFFGVVLGGLLVALTAESLDGRYLSRIERVASFPVVLLCVAWATVQALWLPLSWRAPGMAACAVLTTVCCIVLCVRSALRGGRQSRLVGGGVACLALAWVVVLTFRDFTGGVDFRSALVGILLYAMLLLFRQALLLRERYGRDVLGRAAVSANRDPLTALLSYPGFELAHDETLLRQAAGAHAASMMLFVLPGLDESDAEHGFVITERALVRFAAALQSALGNTWSIARLSRTRFACISTQPYDEAQVVEDATRVLARCARISRPLEPLADFDLRIACLHRPMVSHGLGQVLKELERAALAMVPGKRIAVV